MDVLADGLFTDVDSWSFEFLDSLDAWVSCSNRDAVGERSTLTGSGRAVGLDGVGAALFKMVASEAQRWN